MNRIIPKMPTIHGSTENTGFLKIDTWTALVVVLNKVLHQDTFARNPAPGHEFLGIKLLHPCVTLILSFPSIENLIQSHVRLDTQKPLESCL